MNKSNNLCNLEKYFYGGQAESECEIRNDIFVQPNILKDVLSFDVSKYKIITAPKGVGKSLLLHIINESILSKKDVALLLTPKDIKCGTVNDQVTISDKIIESYNQLILAIGAKLGSFCKKTTFSDSDTRLSKLALTEDYRNKDFVEKIFETLKGSTRFASILAEGAQIAQSISSKPLKIKSDINDSLSKNKNKFWLLIDDIDQAAIYNESLETFDYSICWALISSAIDLADSISNIRVIISIRTDIWHTMTVKKKLGTDRLDKIQRPIELSFTEAEIKNIFLKRVQNANFDQSGKSISTIETFFETKQVRLPGVSQTKRPWADWISKSSRNRPRDLVQLVQKLIEICKKHDLQKIDSHHAQLIIKDFAKTRALNIEREFSQICPQVKYVMRSFSKSKLTFDEILMKLSKAPSERSMSIDGKALHPNTNESAVLLLNVLYMAGFINARKDNLIGNTYSHITFFDRPDLVTIDNFSELKLYQWEIHPVFHDFLFENKNNPELLDSYL